MNASIPETLKKIRDHLKAADDELGECTRYPSIDCVDELVEAVRLLANIIATMNKLEVPVDNNTDEDEDVES